MTEPGLAQLWTAATYGLLALAWTAILTDDWRLQRRLRSPRLSLALRLDAMTAAYLGLLAAVRLAPPELFVRPPGWMVAIYVVADWMLLGLATHARHMARYFGVRGDPPGRAWLVVNYGGAVVVGFLTAFFPSVFPAAPFARQLTWYLTIRNVFIGVVFGLTVVRIARGARRGALRAGASALVPRWIDVALMGAAVAAMAWVTWAVAQGQFRFPTPGGFLADLLIVVPVTLPWLVRKAGVVLRVLLLGIGTLGVTALAFAGMRARVSPLAAAGLTRLADVITVVVLAVAVAVGLAVLRTFVDRVVYRRRRRFWGELQEFLGTLPPEDGVAECCRRALGALREALGLRGVAVLLRDGTAVAAGDFDVEPLRRVWPSGDAMDRLALPPRLTLTLHDMPLAVAEAMIALDVVSASALRSPRRSWGFAFCRGGVIKASLGDDDEAALLAFYDQLALVLDTADLLARAVAVERSLAHAEKLAAIGETAARIAHEIRNPVTAARSLAQQLSREPDSPFRAEHVLIVTELERIERQVATLLRFARKEEYRFGAVDLGELVRGTAAPFAARCAVAGIALELDAPDGVVAHADREKLRQVLINLLDNGIDALEETAADRRLRVAVVGVNGTATIRVEDSGPGVSPDALPHLFEPFWSGKAKGTGLGLAIARRTVLAHGGRIDAAPVTGGGLAVEVVLPVSHA